jgi:hypothetical protein
MKPSMGNSCTGAPLRQTLSSSFRYTLKLISGRSIDSVFLPSGGKMVPCSGTSANTSPAVSPPMNPEAVLVLLVAGGGIIALGVRKIFFATPRSRRTRSKT